MASPELENPITVEEIRRLMVRERPDLVDVWDEENTSAEHFARVAANAEWMWDRNVVDASTSLRPLPPTHQLRIYSISQAIWLATVEDLDNENFYGPDPGDEPLTETQLRSGWFLTS